VSALCYLDSLQYIIHRDIAARNFLVTHYHNVKLADFGRARYVYDDHYQAPSSDTVSIKWSSPEVLLRSCYSTRSDLWAAAVVMWEVMSRGQRPYSCLTGEQTAVYVLNGGRLEQPDNCPPSLYTVMADCWRHSPTDRPSSSELARRLHEISQTVSDSQQDVSEGVMSHDSLRHRLVSSSADSASLSASGHRQSTVTGPQLLSSSSSSSSSVRRRPPGVAASSSADDLLLTRSDKIRHSLRKLVSNMKV